MTAKHCIRQNIQHVLSWRQSVASVDEVIDAVFHDEFGLSDCESSKMKVVMISMPTIFKEDNRYVRKMHYHVFVILQ